MSKYLYPQHQNNKFVVAQFIVTNEKLKNFALSKGYIEVSDEDYARFIKHELCWENGILVPYVAVSEELIEQQKLEIERQIVVLKKQLSSWDYKNSKYLDGEYTEEEWKDILIQRKAWREEINSLEYKLQELSI